MQGPIPPRIVIQAKDVMNITGRKERAARALLARLRKQYGKKARDFITVTEFAQFTGLKVEALVPYLRD